MTWTGQAFRSTHQSSGFTRWMHWSTSSIGEMARDGYFDGANTDGYPVRPGDIIDVLAGRASATPRQGSFVVDANDGSRITVSVRNMGEIANAGSRFFGNPTDDNTQFFKDMLDNPGIYTVPVGNWRIPNMSAYEIQPGEYTFIGADSNHCILDFSEQTAEDVIRLALGTGYKLRFVNIGLKAAGTVKFIDIDNHAFDQVAGGYVLDEDSLVIDELLFDNVNADLFDSIFHADPGRFETPSNAGAGVEGDFLTINKITVRDSKFTNIWDAPFEMEMGRLYNAHYTGNYFSDLGQGAIFHGAPMFGDDRRHHLINHPGLITGTGNNPDPTFTSHALGDMVRAVIHGNIINRVGIIGDVAQDAGDRGTNAINCLCDNVVISNNVINHLEHTAGAVANSEGIYTKSHGTLIQGNMMLDAGLAEAYMRLTGGSPDETDTSAAGENGVCSVLGNVLIETRGIYTGGGNNYSKIGGIDVSHANVTVFGNVLEGIPKYGLALRGMSSSDDSGSTEGMPMTMVSGNTFRKCGNQSAEAGNTVIRVERGRRNFLIGGNVIDRPQAKDQSIIRIEMETGTSLLKTSQVVIKDNQCWDEDRSGLGSTSQVFIEFVCGNEVTTGVIVDNNYITYCDNIVKFSASSGAELQNAIIRNNKADTLTAAALDVSANLTQTNWEIYDNPGYLDANKTHDFGTVNAGTTGSTTVTVTDAVAGDVVKVRERSGGLATGLVLSGQVTAANTVTLYCSNVTGGNIAVGSLTYDVWVERRLNP